MGRFTVRNTRSLGRMDFLLSLVRRAIQSTGTKSAKVKGWRRKMVLLMCPSASRVLTSAPIQLLSDTTSVVVQLLARETKERKSFLTKENKNHYLPWKYGSCYGKYVPQKLERSIYMLGGAKRRIRKQEIQSISLATRIIVIVIMSKKNKLLRRISGWIRFWLNFYSVNI